MARRARRRTLSGPEVRMAALFAPDRWHTSGYWLVFATFLVNRFFLGGYQGRHLPFGE